MLQGLRSLLSEVHGYQVPYKNIFLIFEINEMFKAVELKVNDIDVVKSR